MPEGDQQKALELASLLEKKFAATRDESVFISYTELMQSRFLQNRMGLEKLLNTLQQSSAGFLTWKERVGYVPGSELTGDTGGPKHYPIGVEIHVSDPSKLTQTIEGIVRRGSSKETTARTAAKAFKEEITIGELSAGSDGLIRFKNEIVDMRPQLLTLCWIFMSRPRTLLTKDDIKDQLISASKRDTTSGSTIAKYVSELQKKLAPYYAQDVILNSKKDGWRFVPPEKT